MSHKRQKLPYKGPVTLTPPLKLRYLEELAATGLICKSALAVGVTYQSIQVHRRTDPEFAALMEQALEMYRDKISVEVERRGVDGYDEPVWYQGNQVGTVRRFSDRLLEMHAKRFVPEYREHYTADVNLTGGVLVVGARPKDVDEWRREYGCLPAGEPGASSKDESPS